MITTTTTEAQSRDNSDYWSRPKRLAGHLLLPSPLHPDTLCWTFAETLRHSCHLASSSIRVLSASRCVNPPHLPPPALWFEFMHKWKDSLDWHPSSLTKACIATLLIILVRNKKTKEKKQRGNARQKYSLDLLHTVFTIIQNNTSPSSHCPLHPERTVSPEHFFFFKKTAGDVVILSAND